MEEGGRAPFGEARPEELADPLRWQLGWVGLAEAKQPLYTSMSGTFGVAQFEEQEDEKEVLTEGCFVYTVSHLEKHSTNFISQRRNGE